MPSVSHEGTSAAGAEAEARPGRGESLVFQALPQSQGRGFEGRGYPRQGRRVGQGCRPGRSRPRGLRARRPAGHACHNSKAGRARPKPARHVRRRNPSHAGSGRTPAARGACGGRMQGFSASRPEEVAKRPALSAGPPWSVGSCGRLRGAQPVRERGFPQHGRPPRGGRSEGNGGEGSRALRPRAGPASRSLALHVPPCRLLLLAPRSRPLCGVAAGSSHYLVAQHAKSIRAPVVLAGCFRIRDLVLAGSSAKSIGAPLGFAGCFAVQEISCWVCCAPHLAMGGTEGPSPRRPPAATQGQVAAAPGDGGLLLAGHAGGRLRGGPGRPGGGPAPGGRHAWRGRGPGGGRGPEGLQLVRQGRGRTRRLQPPSAQPCSRRSRQRADLKRRSRKQNEHEISQAEISQAERARQISQSDSFAPQSGAHGTACRGRRCTTRRRAATRSRPSRPRRGGASRATPCASGWPGWPRRSRTCQTSPCGASSRGSTSSRSTGAGSTRSRTWWPGSGSR